MTTSVHLTPELERFANECVAGGGYHDVSDVVSAGLRLLQAAREQRHRFEAMLHEAEAEADREGVVSLEDALREADEVINANRK